MEAHATDEWPILDTPPSKQFAQHKTLEERRHACEFTCEEYPLLQSNAGFGSEIYLDTIHNDFNNTFSSWPLRYWVLKEGKLTFKAMPRNATYPLEELDAAIQAVCT